METIDTKKKKELDNKNKKMKLGFGLALLVILLTIFVSKSFSSILDDDVEVQANTDLTYYLDVKYDGVDKNGTKSSDSVVSEVKSDTMMVEDKIPDGLDFTGFVTTSDGSIGAVKRSDGTTCLGKVIDDTNEEVVDTGVWNNDHTEYTYHGLHYTVADRTVRFKVKNLKAGCKLTVGIKTKTPATVDDPNTPDREVRRDFYNFASARERSLTINSNTVHAFMGSETVTMYNVTYQYTGDVPDGAPSAPSGSTYAAGTKVGVAALVDVEGYTFSGWSTTDATVTDGSFTMPAGDVTLKGSFTEIPTKKVTYTLNGDTPDGYVLPSEKNYYPGTIVSLDTLQVGDVINGYRFLGWTTSDATITDGDFEMPSTNVVLVGSFEEVKYKVFYQFYDGVLPPNAENYLPTTKEYKPGATVNVEDVTGEPSGYKFLGWYKEASFEMPESDVTIFGEWKVQAGTFAPTITKEVVNDKGYYPIGDIVRFKIVVTNTANFAIHSVMVKENTENSVFEVGTGYNVLSDHVASIDTMAAGASVTLYSTYQVLGTDSGTVENEAEIIGALADGNYQLAEGDYKATDTFKVQSEIKICKEVSSAYNENKFQFHITNSSSHYDTWMVLAKDECDTINVNPGTYKIREVVPQEYTIKSVTGDMSADNSNLTVQEGHNYEITYTNEFVKKGFFHSFGRVVNKIVQGGN